MTTLKRIVVGLAVLGGTLIVLFWALGMLSRLPSPIGPLAGKAESLMQPH